MYDLSVVIPAYNEEKKISDDIKSVFDYFSLYKINGELIIVDDGSKDKTKNIAESFTHNFQSLRIISYNPNKGKGFAVKKGILEASGKVILLVDAGLCVPFHFANFGLDLLKNSNDIALGSRRINKKETNILLRQPLYRRLGSKLFHFLITICKLIPEGMEDTQCGFKLFKKEIAHNIFTKMFTEKFMWDIEMLRIAKKNNYKIATFPVEWKNDPDTKFRPLIGSVENLIQIINIALRT